MQENHIISSDCELCQWQDVKYSASKSRYHIMVLKVKTKRTVSMRN